MINPRFFLKALLAYGGTWSKDDDKPAKWRKSQPSEVAHLSKKERLKRRRIYRLSRRRR